jgi:hypothetical protein
MGTPTVRFAKAGWRFRSASTPRTTENAALQQRAHVRRSRTITWCLKAVVPLLDLERWQASNEQPNSQIVISMIFGLLKGGRDQILFAG